MDGWWTPAENPIEVKLDKDGKEKEKVTPNYKVVSDPYGRFSNGIQEATLIWLSCNIW
jgi:type I restriction enzyme M protein